MTYKQYLDRNKTWDAKDVPEVGKIYHMFDDGKISLSRHYLMECLDVIPYGTFATDPAYAELFESWKESVRECDWVYCITTDYIIKCRIVDVKDSRILYYARMSDGSSESAVHVIGRDMQKWQWFGFGEWLYNGVLDVTRKIWESLYNEVNNMDMPKDYMDELERLNQY